MTIAQTISDLRIAKKDLKSANAQAELCHEALKDVLVQVPYTMEDIRSDFNNFCNNSQQVIDEDFEDIRDPNEVMEDIEEAVNSAGNLKDLRLDSEHEYLQEAVKRCNAYLAVRDRWMVEICYDLMERN